MATHSTFPGLDPYGSKPSGGEANIAVDPSQRRAQIERERQERIAERQQLLSLQSSPHSTPEERVHLWERLHGLTMPRAPTHPLLRVIARATDLSIAQMHDIQRRRAGADGSAVASGAADASRESVSSSSALSESSPETDSVT
jgi:hypothetical protein